MSGIDFTRRYGVLLHPTALKTPWGIGDIGKSSRKLVDWLHESGATVWQLLPTGVTDKWGCPYSSYSAFGGNPMLICLEDLVADGLLSESQLITSWDDYTKVNFQKSWDKKRKVLKDSFENFKNDPTSEKVFSDFLSREGYWVHDLANFLVLTEMHGDDWTKWPVEIRDREVDEMDKFETNHSDDISFQIYLQFLFEKQWNQMKSYAHSKDVKLFGDIPIFIAHHSMDVWRHPELFKLKDDGDMEVETGAPPDSFSESGQKWATPNYNWETMRSLDYQWWVDRVRYLSEKFDLLRLDHFIGFVHVWESPKIDPDARNGAWSPTPGREMFKVFEEKIGKLPFIAEDLGAVDAEVLKLRDDFQFPGMKILQFAFGGDDANDHLPENTPENFVVYTGTHDNNTVLGWYEERQQAKAEDELDRMYEILSKYSNKTAIHDKFLETAMKTKAFLCVFPIQDIFGLGGEARFNYPGTTDASNWSWTMDLKMLSPKRAGELTTMAKETGRL
ncbi:MAG: 4-alpha-glucanotransferase [Deltaproteobacteria bacterium]|nr:MAG: 4-alpha-glucanotransferase [Deltaproteobacteria bacterium]